MPLNPAAMVGVLVLGHRRADLDPTAVEQAIERSGTKLGNRGFSAAQSAIEMANLIKTIEK